MIYALSAIIGAVIFGLIGMFIYGRRSGRESQRVGDLEKTDEVQDAQLEVATKPHDPAAVVDRLRKHDF